MEHEVTPSGIGRVLHYLLVERLGSWGLGDSFRARDTIAGRTVVLRLAPDTAFPDRAVREAFLADATRAAALSHPNLAALFDVREYEAGCCLATEFTAGATLSREMGEGPVNPRRAVDLAAQVADAVAEVHAHGMVHGDLRPHTVFVTQKGRVKVLEAGLSRWTLGGRLRRESVSSPATASPLVAGYLSPEQAAGLEADGRTDVFSLGVILHEMLSGRHPFASPRAAETLAALRAGAAVPAVTAAGIPPALAALVARACAIDPAARPRSMAAFAGDLRRAGARMAGASSDPPAALFGNPEVAESRHPGWVAAAVVVLIAVAVWWAMR